VPETPSKYKSPEEFKLRLTYALHSDDAQHHLRQFLDESRLEMLLSWEEASAIFEDLLNKDEVVFGNTLLLLSVLKDEYYEQMRCARDGSSDDVQGNGGDTYSPIDIVDIMLRVARSIYDNQFDRLIDEMKSVLSIDEVDQAKIALQSMYLRFLSIIDSVEFRDHQRNSMPTSEAVSARFRDVEMRQHGRTRGCEHLTDVLDMADRVRRVLQFRSDVESCNKSQLEADRLEYGAKGAYLNSLSDLFERLRANPDFCNLVSSVSIPEYSLVSVEVYQKYMQGIDIRDDLKVIFDRFKGKPIIVRSSAVYSEDGDETTGAGVYASVSVCHDSPFEEFYNAVIEVYESVSSDLAKEYREEHDVAEEVMGIVVQERVEYGRNTELNTVRPFCPHLYDITLPGQHHKTLLNKQRAIDAMIAPETSKGIGYMLEVPSDEGRSRKELYESEDIIRLGLFLEEFFEKAVQIEAVVVDTGTHLVQTRPLPSRLCEPADVEFPENTELLYESRSSGVCDDMFEFLPVDQVNSDSKGIVIFISGYGGSMVSSKVNSALPGEGVVVITQQSEMFRGHIETRSLERGLTLLYVDHKGTYIQPTQQILFDVFERTRQLMWESGPLGVTALSGGMTRVRVVSDGSIARIYRA
jgi:hypothetical protein